MTDAGQTLWCALCRAEYRAGVSECAACLVPLVQTQPLTCEQVGNADEQQLGYECEDVDNLERLHVDQRLGEAGIPHAWDGSWLVVRAADGPAVEEILPAANGDEVLYDLDDWAEEQRAELTATLEASHIAYDWDENGDLVVQAADEQRVAAIIDAAEYPDQLAVDNREDDEGSAGAHALSEMFVAADRLMHDPDNHEAILSLHDAARLAESLAVPYGFQPTVWHDVTERAASMRQLLEREADDSEVRETARALRNLLRPWV